jgi:hypothetical protein
MQRSMLHRLPSRAAELRSDIRFQIILRKETP